jgi:hypothetical protein
MSTTPVAAGQGLLTASLATLYTVPTNRKFILKAATFANHTGGALTLIVECTQSGGMQRRYIERTVDDNASDLAVEFINQVFAAGDVIQASGLNMTYLLSGILLNA